jgi:hypothetical protein
LRRKLTAAVLATALTEKWPAGCWSKEQQEIIERYGYTSRVQVYGGKTESGEMVWLVGNISAPSTSPRETQ